MLRRAKSGEQDLVTKNQSQQKLMILKRVIKNSYKRKVKSSRPDLRENRDKRPMGRDPDKSWFHRHSYLLTYSILLNIMFLHRWKDFRINLPLFSTVLPSNSRLFLSCGSFVVITTLSKVRVGLKITSVCVCVFV